MKKNYEAPSVEVVKFQYRDQVVAASNIPSLSCTQNWVGLGDGNTPNCSHTVAVPDSGY